MKRLQLADFINKQPNNTKITDQLLGQVLGDCHDQGGTFPGGIDLSTNYNKL